MLRIQFSDFWTGWEPNNNFWIESLDKLQVDYEIVNVAPDLLIASCFGASFLNIKARKKLFWSGENWFRMNQKIDIIGGSMLDYFDMVYSFDYDDSPNHYRLPLYLIDTMESKIEDYNQICRTKTKDELYSQFPTRKFSTFVQANGNCEFRNKYLYLLNQIDRVDSFGSLFNNTGRVLNRPEKIEVTKDYKFQLSFENSEYDGYVTEKIIDALKSDIIPIYWGGSKVSQEFNPEAFIDVNSLGVDKSLKIVEDMNKDFELYWSYYNQKIISDNQTPLKQRIDDFLINFKNFIESI